jgi:hypothetical protein
MLSHREQQELRSIERTLRETDAEWVQAVFGDLPGHPGRVRMVLCIAVDVMAFVLIVVGAVTAIFPAIFVGFVAANAGVCMHIDRRGPPRR